MLEIFLVGLVTITIVRTAKGRGASPWLHGAVTVVGYVLLRIAAAGILAAVFLDDPTPASGAVIAVRLAATILPFIWLGAMYLYVRSVPGRGHAQPEGQWTCPECRWLNASAVFRCEACGHEYQSNRQPS